MLLHTQNEKIIALENLKELAMSLKERFFQCFEKTNNKLPRKRTDLAFLAVTPKGFKLLERAPRVSVEHSIASTLPELIIDGDIPEMVIY